MLSCFHAPAEWTSALTDFKEEWDGAQDSYKARLGAVELIPDTRMNALHLAAALGDTDLIHELVRADASLLDAQSFTGRTPLNMAAEYSAKAVQALLTYLEHIKYGSERINAADSDGMTPLHYAARCNPQAIVPLCDRGAKVNVKESNYGFTPLHYAACNYNEDPRVVGALLARGADMYIVTTMKETILHLATIYDNVNMIKYLLEYIDLDFKEEDGWGHYILIWYKNENEETFLDVSE